MKRRGFDPDVTSAAIEKMPRENEIESAERLAKSVWEKAARLETLKRKKKVFDTLIRRGYDYGIAQKCAETLSRHSASDEPVNDSQEFQDQE